MRISTQFAKSLIAVFATTLCFADEGQKIHVDCLQKLPTVKGIYLTLAKDEKWTVKQHSDKPLFAEPWPENTEMIFVPQNLHTVYTVYANLPYYKKEGKGYVEIQCSAWVSAKSYSGCKSEFFSTNVAGTAGRTAIAAVLTLGLAAGANKSLSQRRVLEVVAEADALNYAKNVFRDIEASNQKAQFDKATTISSLQAYIRTYSDNDLAGLIPEARRQLYRKEFAAATTSEQLEAFVTKYADNDSEGLTAKAQQHIPEAKAQEAAAARRDYKAQFESVNSSIEIQTFIDRFAGNDPDQLVPIAKKKHAEALKKEAAEQKRAAQQREDEARREAKREADEAKARQAKLDAWRRSLKVGDDTFCGPVIELRPPMVKVAVSAPLPGYPGEVWLKVPELYPNWMAGCQNTNGHLSPTF